MGDMGGDELAHEDVPQPGHSSTKLMANEPPESSNIEDRRNNTFGEVGPRILNGISSALSSGYRGTNFKGSSGMKSLSKDRLERTK